LRFGAGSLVMPWFAIGCSISDMEVFYDPGSMAAAMIESPRRLYIVER